MKRYYIELWVRPEGTKRGDESEEFKVNTAVSDVWEVGARHQALEEAWKSNLLVSKFLSVRVAVPRSKRKGDSS